MPKGRKMKIKAKQFEITTSSPTYFIADIAANHDGELDRALQLIELAAKAGANAAKFQHFKAETIVSDIGFRKLGTGMAHQKRWSKSVVEVYREAELPLSWTESLKSKCDAVGIDFFSAIYDLEYLDILSSSMPFFKIGSGDITWAQMLKKTAQFGKPMFIATGASSMREVQEALEVVASYNLDVCLMQCNTNYTGDETNPSYANLRVISEYRKAFPDLILGLSDHTSTNTTALGAIALGATVVEKHFTDDRGRSGPDHAFSLDFQMWRDMVSQARELEASLGDGNKKVEDNELESQIVQRRAARVKRKVNQGETISQKDISFLRPCPNGAATPYDFYNRTSVVATTSLEEGEFIPKSWLEV